MKEKRENEEMERKRMIRRDKLYLSRRRTRQKDRESHYSVPFEYEWKPEALTTPRQSIKKVSVKFYSL